MAIGTLTGLSAGVATFLEGQIDLSPSRSSPRPP
jgi:hypothetical protein